jgi:hypothetical protein
MRGPCAINATQGVKTTISNKNTLTVGLVGMPLSLEPRGLFCLGLKLNKSSYLN